MHGYSGGKRAERCLRRRCIKEKREIPASRSLACRNSRFFRRGDYLLLRLKRLSLQSICRRACFLFFQFFHVFHTEISARGGNNGDHCKDGNEKRVIVIDQPAAAIGGRKNGRYSGNAGYDQKRQKFCIRQTDKIRNDIFWRTGDEINNEQQQIFSFCVFQETPFIDLFDIHKDLYKLHAERLGEGKNNERTDLRAQHAIEKSAESAPHIAGADLQRFRRNDLDDRLERADKDKHHIGRNGKSIQPSLKRLLIRDNVQKFFAERKLQRKKAPEHDRGRRAGKNPLPFGNAF